jgi:hypothetical protein
MNYLSTLSLLYFFLNRLVNVSLLDEKNKSRSSPVRILSFFAFKLSLLDSNILLSTQYTKHVQFLFWDSRSFRLAFIQHKRKVEITNYTTFLLCTEVTNFMTAAQFKACTDTHIFNACKDGIYFGGNVTAIPVNESFFTQKSKHLTLTDFSRNGSETGSNTFIQHRWMIETWNICKSVEAQIHWINDSIKGFFTFKLIMHRCLLRKATLPPCMILLL